MPVVQTLPASLKARHIVVLLSLAWCAGAHAQAQAPRALQAITVQGNGGEEALPAVAPGGQAATGARLGTLGNADVLDAPVSISAYTEQLIKEQQARTVADVLQSDPSVRYTTNSGHMLEHFQIRGLDVLGSSLALNGLYGLAPAGHVPTEFLERVEVLRGPNALLNGMAPDGLSLGGTINLVTKRAKDEPITEFTTSWSSDSYFQGHVDIGRRFGEEKRLGLRFNGVYGQGDTGVADQEKGRQLGTLGLDYRGDGWEASLDAYVGREKIKNGSPAMYGLATRRGAAVGVGELVDVPDADSNMFKGTQGVYRTSGFMLRGSVRLADRLEAYAGVGAANSRGQGLMFGTRTIVTDTAGNATGYVYNVDTANRTRSGEIGLRGSFDTGPVLHKVNVALSALSYKDGTSNRANEGWAQNIYDPVAPVFPQAPDAPEMKTNNLLTSLALTDTLEMLDGRVQVILGARQQRVRQPVQQYDESRLSPSAGLVLKPWGENTSLYANYMEGLAPGQMVPLNQGYENEGQVFKPLVAKQMEIGLKQRLGSFTHTLSAFQIDRPTLVSSKTAPKVMSEGGKQRLKGLEWTMYGELVPTLDILGGVVYTQARQRDTGKDSYGVPEWAANLGLKWATPVQGLSIGGRVIYTGAQWADSANTLRLPSSHRYDLSAEYATKIASTPVTFNLYVENLTDRKYWSGLFGDGYLMPAAQRTVRLSATFAF